MTHSDVTYPIVSEIGTALSAWLTGQPSLAAFAIFAKPALSRPATSPLTWRRIAVIPTPGWKSTSADVRNCVGGVPALVNSCDSAMEKQEACAAAINSSGLVVPFGSSLRDGQLTSKEPTFEETIVTIPLP